MELGQLTYLGIALLLNLSSEASFLIGQVCSGDVIIVHFESLVLLRRFVGYS